MQPGWRTRVDGEFGNSSTPGGGHPFQLGKGFWRQRYLGGCQIILAWNNRLHHRAFIHWIVEYMTLGQLAIFCDGRIYLFPPTGFSGRPRNGGWAAALVFPLQSGAELARARTGSL